MCWRTAVHTDVDVVASVPLPERRFSSCGQAHTSPEGAMASVNKGPTACAGNGTPRPRHTVGAVGQGTHHGCRAGRGVAGPCRSPRRWSCHGTGLKDSGRQAKAQGQHGRVALDESGVRPSRGARCDVAWALCALLVEPLRAASAVWEAHSPCTEACVRLLQV